MKYVFDMKRQASLRLLNGVAYDDITGETFNYTLDDEDNFYPLPQLVYENIILNIQHYIATGETEHELINEVRTELKRYVG
ncbi:hypothetical protein [Bacillus cihuensis]|uniref:hypothetical protein n=1 Tax=Bacillus cihuensis TaxID=1208599 RepID=UPI00040F3DE2|nr:hypothetical protein [Bacillus cihuensis]